ncbi:entericidin A/B family lipoprotein [Luteolibacter yonseiensis]|uniref:Entericidin A/B family lipoprotein n=1 Tax=Luteolibacter yonseiensis TaxID=1144680 RepID=A0A934VBE1_9BACT|nr:entericidin A/B family lipoprotein [Luteolibacter yonseiensis]MBK1816050.1 entericidin A/B family lipoprotein [Luteolibacter yonseiensis]
MNPIIISKTNCQTVKPNSARLLTLAAGALLLLAGATTSCSTTKGFGQDVEKTGDKIQNAAAAAQR